MSTERIGKILKDQFEYWYKERWEAAKQDQANREFVVPTRWVSPADLSKRYPAGAEQQRTINELAEQQQKMNALQNAFIDARNAEFESLGRELEKNEWAALAADGRRQLISGEPGQIIQYTPDADGFPPGFVPGDPDPPAVEPPPAVVTSARRRYSED